MRVQGEKGSKISVCQMRTCFCILFMVDGGYQIGMGSRFYWSDINYLF